MKHEQGIMTLVGYTQLISVEQPLDVPFDSLTLCNKTFQEITSVVNWQLAQTQGRLDDLWEADTRMITDLGRLACSPFRLFQSADGREGKHAARPGRLPLLDARGEEKRQDDGRPATAAPVAASAARFPEAAFEPAASSRAQGRAILLIDDDAGMQRALRRILQRDGYDVSTAINGLKGLAALEERTYEVILCDIRMPELDGPGFYREMTRRYPHLVSRIVFLTGDALSPQVEAFFTQVDRPRLLKPFRAQEVRQVIQQVLEA
jgi:CheY-like chemotaxis protein